MNPFHRDKFYVRRGMMDCCMYVQKRQFEDHKRIVLRVSWYLKRNMIPMGFTESVTIYKNNMDGWHEITE